MSTLQKLIRACADDGRMLQHESKLVDARRSRALRRLARERARFVAELSTIQPRAAARRSTGSWIELVREACRDLFVFAVGSNTGDSISACRHSRARTEKQYDKALEAAFPDEARRTIEAQRLRLHAEADELVHL